MANAGRWIHDPTRMHLGDPIEVWYEGHLHCVGSVQQTARALGVVRTYESPVPRPRRLHRDA